MMLELFARIGRSRQLAPEWPAVAVNTMGVCDALLESHRTKAIVPLEGDSR